MSFMWIEGLNYFEACTEIDPNLNVSTLSNFSHVNFRLHSVLLFLQAEIKRSSLDA